MTKVFVGDVGTIITLDCGTDVSTSTERSIVVRKSNGEKVTWPATLSGTNSISYTTQENDLDVVGLWSIQAAITMPSWSGLGEITSLLVNRQL